MNRSAAQVKSASEKRSAKAAPRAASSDFKTLMSADNSRRLQAVRDGLNPAMLDEAARYLEMPKQALLQAIGMPVSTATRKAKGRIPLSLEESDKVDRVARVVRRAQQVFGDEAQMRAWLTDPVLALGGRAPLALLDSHTGYEMVMDALGRISYGAIA